MAVLSVNLSVKKRCFILSKMWDVDIDGIFVDAFMFLNAEWFNGGLSSFEIGWLVHIDPDS